MAVTVPKERVVSRWIRNWYTNYAIGTCRNIALGPFSEPDEEFKEEFATCVAWYHEAADVYLKRLGLDKSEIQVIKEELDKKAKELFGDKTWRTAKYIASHFKEVFNEISKSVY